MSPHYEREAIAAAIRARLGPHSGVLTEDQLTALIEPPIAAMMMGVEPKQPPDVALRLREAGVPEAEAERKANLCAALIPVMTMAFRLKQIEAVAIEGKDPLSVELLSAAWWEVYEEVSGLSDDDLEGRLMRS